MEVHIFKTLPNASCILSSPGAKLNHNISDLSAALRDFHPRDVFFFYSVPTIITILNSKINKNTKLPDQTRGEEMNKL